jgi:hypothetical protein
LNERGADFRRGLHVVNSSKSQRNLWTKFGSTAVDVGRRVPTWEPSCGKVLRPRAGSQSEVIAPSAIFPIGSRSDRSRFQRSISRHSSSRGQKKLRAFQWFTGYFASVLQVFEADCRTILSGVHIRDFLCDMHWPKSLGMAHQDPHSRFISFGCELI